MARKTTARRDPKISNLEASREAARTVTAGIIIHGKTASTLSQPGAIRGFNPQPDPPGSAPKA